MRTPFRNISVRRGVCGIAVTLAMCFLMSYAGAAEDQPVTVTGQAEIIGNNKDAAQKKALADAFRQAVEKGLGVWIKSETEVKNAMVARDEILSRAEGYVTDHEIVKESVKENLYQVTIKAKVSIDKIGTDFKKLVGRVKTQMGNPSITFVLTTWLSRGKRETSSQTVYGKMDEKLWKKYPDPTIIDAFQQEFKEKNFDLKATDKAREIALVESVENISVDLSDRRVIREQAEKELANFVARGEAKIIDIQKSDTGNFDVTAQVGVEIIDVNSGDIVSSYSNTATASSKSEENAKVQSIKKIATLGARTLADQTIATWQERALSGWQYTIEVRNVTSMRKQKKPIMDAIESVAQITNQTSPESNILVISVMYKGDKKKLGDDVLGQLESKPGFSEKEFDGPDDQGGKIVFKFTK